ncbi:MAG: HEAT repeat domain-containing protein [Planctomycetota bacterium]
MKTSRLICLCLPLLPLCAFALLASGPNEAPESFAQNAAGAAASDHPGADRRAADRSSVAPALAIGAYGAPVGRQVRSELSLTSTNRLARGDAAQQQVEVSLQGSLEWTVAARDEHRIAVELRMPGMRARIASGSMRKDQELAPLAEPTVVLLSDEGRVLGYRFPKAADAELRNWVRTIVSAQLVTVRGVGDHDELEADASGIARVRVHVRAEDGGLQVAREKLGYEPRGGHRVELQGRGEIAFPSGLGWVGDVTAQDSLRFAMSETGMTVQVDATTHIVTRGYEDGHAVDASIDLGGSYADASGADDVDREGAERARDERIAERLRGKTTQGLVQDMLDLIAQGKTGDVAFLQARELLIELLRRDGTAPDILRRMLDTAGNDPRTEGELISALGAADTAAARALLTAMFSDGARGEGMRLSALQSLFQVAHLEGDAFAAAQRLVLDPTESVDLSGTSLLLMGAEAGDVDRIAALIALRDRAVERGLLGHWLEALGNSGRPEVEDAVGPFLTDSRSAIRTAAIGALRKLSTATAIQAMAEALRADASTSARVEALHGLLGRDDATAVAAIRSAAEHDAEPRVRGAAIEALGEMQGDPQARATLSRIAANDPVAELRARAGALAAR